MSGSRQPGATAASIIGCAAARHQTLGDGVPEPFGYLQALLPARFDGEGLRQLMAVAQGFVDPGATFRERRHAGKVGILRQDSQSFQR